MHLLAATPGGYSDESQVVSLNQSPADWVILTAADTEAMLISRAYGLVDNLPSMRIGHLNFLRNHASVDLYVDETMQHAKVIVASLLGGTRYWPYLTEQLMLLQHKGVVVILFAGDDSSDDELVAKSSIAPEQVTTLWQYLRYGGLENTRHFLAYLALSLSNNGIAEPPPPRQLAELSLSWGSEAVDAQDLTAIWQPNQPVVALLYYRNHLMSANCDAIEGMADALIAHGLNPMPIAVSSLKNNLVVEGVRALLAEHNVRIIIDTTAFAVNALDSGIGEIKPTLFGTDRIVLQAILAGTSEAVWQNGNQGLNPRELAMHVVLPEIDGKVITIPISFKEKLYYDESLEIGIVGHRRQAERAQRLAELCQHTDALQRCANADKHIALLVANYPVSDGRIANGVGLDVPNTLIHILDALRAAGYAIDADFEDGGAIIESLLQGVTNDSDQLPLRKVRVCYSLEDYACDLAQLPNAIGDAVSARWGAPADDPFVIGSEFALAVLPLGNVIIGIQPARGYEIDIDANYHDPDLVPPHYYLAFYCWLRFRFRTHAIVQVGKHGNLEWLPGKGVALGATCWPDAIMGAVPNFYPFIVNDPGEGTQAKRRSHSIVVDHLMPPLVRAESYGKTEQLESLVDEYYHASQLDPRRATALKKDIARLVKASHLDRDLGLNDDLDANALNDLDTYLCDLKEAQIRGGLHVIGKPMPAAVCDETLLSLVLIPRGNKTHEQSIITALATDFGFKNIEAIISTPAEPWTQSKPALLNPNPDSIWRTNGDTMERLKAYALTVIAREQELPSNFDHSAPVFAFIEHTLKPLLARCPEAELNNLLNALDGNAVAAGPCGAPSRGRLDILPTGRNFYSVDTRSIPTQTAWRLGFAAADAFIERYVQDHGDYPRQITLSVWGTATMRTGGDDIAQILALIGARPIWDTVGHRVVDFEILPVSALGRPRVDVTVRISGFFRDAFENIVALLDDALTKVASLDESGEDNALRQHNDERKHDLLQQGATHEEAELEANFRIFGSKPGAYGAGLQGLIEHRNWQDRNDLGTAFINWSRYAYGKNRRGDEAEGALVKRLKQTQAILHNQDNREHDILDADDYYQFQGGIAAAATSVGNDSASLYHGDHQNPARPRVRALGEEINRVMRSRALNPKWLQAMRRHGYKGAFEMAATVDYLFAFDATTGLVEDWHYAALTDAYLLDASSREFLQKNNPHAMRDMAERMLEAIQRELWQDNADYAEKLRTLILETEHQLESNG